MPPACPAVACLPAACPHADRVRAKKQAHKRHHPLRNRPKHGQPVVQRAMVRPEGLAHCFSRLNQAASTIEGYPLDPRLEALRGLTFLVETDST